MRMDSDEIGQKRTRDGKAAALYIFDERKKKGSSIYCTLFER